MFLFVQQLWSNISKQIVKYLSRFLHSTKAINTILQNLHIHMRRSKCGKYAKYCVKYLLWLLTFSPYPRNITYYNITYIGPDSWKCNYRVQSQARFKTQRWKLEFQATVHCPCFGWIGHNRHMGETLPQYKQELICSKKRQMCTFLIHTEIISYFFKINE